MQTGNRKLLAALGIVLATFAAGCNEKVKKIDPALLARTQFSSRDHIILSPSPSDCPPPYPGPQAALRRATFKSPALVVGPGSEYHGKTLILVDECVGGAPVNAVERMAMDLQKAGHRVRMGMLVDTRDGQQIFEGTSCHEAFRVKDKKHYVYPIQRPCPGS